MELGTMKKGFKEKYREAGKQMKESRKNPGISMKEIEEFIEEKNIDMTKCDDSSMIINKSDLPLVDDIVRKARYVKRFDDIKNNNKICLKIL